MTTRTRLCPECGWPVLTENNCRNNCHWTGGNQRERTAFGQPRNAEVDRQFAEVMEEIRHAERQFPTQTTVTLPKEHVRRLLDALPLADARFEPIGTTQWIDARDGGEYLAIVDEGGFSIDGASGVEVFRRA